MSELAVITPSYAPDADLFAELHRSVLAHTSDDTVHHVIVPPADRALFSQYGGPRCRVWTYPELLPRRYTHLPRTGLWMNLRRPWPPVRGWVMQQTLKIAAAGAVDADVVLLADSDVVLVRPTASERFTTDGRLRLYREEKAVTSGMDRHVRWHHVARRLLGLPPAPEPPLPDYVSPLNFWDPQIVRAMQQRIRETTGRDWMDAFNSQLHISEFILYGVFVDEILGASTAPPLSDITICYNRWDRTPLDHDEAMAFADRLPSDAIAMMISAKSNTPQGVRLAAARRCAELVGE
ncbi:DUF6492 family protein [Sphaerimonospora cavernae]|uniref:DUF6492 family protein n=1 Tax=Sphaerimonospora cavernae TaxID=1740611 RepID=A0ABV6U8Z2_9ACTN